MYSYRMSLLHVIQSVDPRHGGPIEGIRQLAGTLASLGHSIEVLSCDSPDDPWVREFPLPVHAVGPTKGRYSYAPKLTPWLLDNAPKYDIVIVNGIWQYTSFGTWRAMRRLRRPYLVYTHGMLDPWFKRTYRLKHLKKLLYWPWGEYRVLRDAAAVLFTCDEERLLARQSFSMYRANERVVHYGTSVPLNDPDSQREAFYAAFPELRYKRLLLYLSRIHPKKGCDMLIRAFAATCSDDPSLRLMIAGPDQVGWEADLRKLAASLNVLDRIVWPGMIVGDIKWGAYRACEAFVLPSHQENFGIVVAEALACSKPVLISNRVNIWREVRASGAGIVADDTLEGTSSLISQWLALTDEAKASMASRSLECFDNHFEIRYAAQALADVIHEQLDSNSPAPATLASSA